MTKPLLIIGTGGLAGEVGHLAKQIDPQGKRWSAISYVAESANAIGEPRPFGRVDYCVALRPRIPCR